MKTIIGVRFGTAGKVYYFDPEEHEVKRGAHVIVETSRGMEYGTVVLPSQEIEEEKITQPLKPIIRIASEKDTEQYEENREKEKKAVPIAKEKIREHGLEMKLIDVEYTFDRSKIVFYFTADGRVDFRELVKDLAGVFRTRIELRQIGVRDATKMLGGIGSCGRELCCHAYMQDFIPVSIKMAKEQSLSLNPGKISGMCGRLMCCLQYEADTYAYLNKKLPRPGDIVTTPYQTDGTVHSVDVLRQRVKVIVDVGDEKEIEEYPVEELVFKARRGSKREDQKLSAEEMKELEKLEKEEGGGGSQEKRKNKGDRKDRGNRNDQGQGEGRGNEEGRGNRGDRRGNGENREGHQDQGNRENGGENNGSGEQKKNRNKGKKNRNKRDGRNGDRTQNSDVQSGSSNGGNGSGEGGQNNNGQSGSGNGNGSNGSGDAT